MRRYAVRRPRLVGCNEDDLYWQDIFSPMMPMVYESPDDYEDTGLIDSDGNEIIRFVGVLPIGFLADHSEE